MLQDSIIKAYVPSFVFKTFEESGMMMHIYNPKKERLGHKNLLEFGVDLNYLARLLKKMLFSIPITSFRGLEKIPKFIWHQKRSRIARVNLSNKNKAGSISILDFKLCYKTIVIKMP